MRAVSYWHHTSIGPFCSHLSLEHCWCAMCWLAAAGILCSTVAKATLAWLSAAWLSLSPQCFFFSLHQAVGSIGSGHGNINAQLALIAVELQHLELDYDQYGQQCQRCEKKTLNKMKEIFFAGRYFVILNSSMATGKAQLTWISSLPVVLFQIFIFLNYFYKWCNWRGECKNIHKKMPPFRCLQPCSSFSCSFST